MDKFNDISNKIKYQIVGEPTEDEKKAAANKIWEICKESPAIGNAVMDLLGDDAYQRVMMYKKKDISVKTNQDAFAEKLRNMKPEHLAEYLSCDIFVCEQNCPIYDKYGYSRCPEGIGCEEAIVKWLKEEIK